MRFTDRGGRSERSYLGRRRWEKRAGSQWCLCTQKGGEISVGGFLLLLGLNEKCLLHTNVFYLIYSYSICYNSKNQNFGAAGQLPVTAGRNHLLNDLINHFIPVFAHSDCTP